MIFTRYYHLVLVFSPVSNDVSMFARHNDVAHQLGSDTVDRLCFPLEIVVVLNNFEIQRITLSNSFLGLRLLDRYSVSCSFTVGIIEISLS